MSGSTLAVALIPIVVVVTLFAWIFLVYRADRRPQAGGPGQAPDRDVTSGIFHGDPRQLSPRRDTPASETPQRVPR